MTYSPGWWRSKNARVRISGILGFNSLICQTLKNNIFSLRTLLVELINVTSSKSDLNRSPCLHHLLCNTGNYFWVLQLLILLGFGQNIFSISYHIWSRWKFTLWELGEKYTAFAGVGEAMLEKRERGSEAGVGGREEGGGGRWDDCLYIHENWLMIMI